MARPGHVTISLPTVVAWLDGFVVGRFPRVYRADLGRPCKRGRVFAVLSLMKGDMPVSVAVEESIAEVRAERPFKLRDMFLSRKSLVRYELRAAYI